MALVEISAKVGARRTPPVDPPGLALTPPMGYNNYNATHVGPDFNEDFMVAQADLMVSLGLRDAGYDYVNLDDCWARATSAGGRDGNGDLVPHPERFPSGIADLADYIHSLDMKIGLYSSAGSGTCAGGGQSQPGSLGFEEQDVALWASWGIDYVKYDNCPSGQGDNVARFTPMGAALSASPRPMVYSICNWGEESVWEWGGSIGGHLWRTTLDIEGGWSNWRNIANANAQLAQYAGPGGWNDPDMLQVGNGAFVDEIPARTHMSLWAIMAAPLIIGTDLREVTQTTLDTLLNPEVIAIDQDPLGAQGVQLEQGSGTTWRFVKPLASGDVALAFCNHSTSGPRTLSITAAQAGIPDATYNVRDLWTGAEFESGPTFTAEDIPLEGTALWRVSVD